MHNTRVHKSRKNILLLLLMFLLFSSSGQAGTMCYTSDLPLISCQVFAYWLNLVIWFPHKSQSALSEHNTYVLICVKICFEQSMFLHFLNLGHRPLWKSMKWHHQTTHISYNLEHFPQYLFIFTLSQILQANIFLYFICVLQIIEKIDAYPKWTQQCETVLLLNTQIQRYRGIEADVQLWNSRWPDILDGPILLYPCIHIRSWGSQ